MEKAIIKQIQAELTKEKLKELYNASNFNIPLEEFIKHMKDENNWYQDWFEDNGNGTLIRAFHCRLFKGHIQVLSHYTYDDSPQNCNFVELEWEIDPLIIVKIESALKDVLDNILFDFNLNSSYRIVTVKRNDLEKMSDIQFKDYVLDHLKFLYELILHERLKSLRALKEQKS